MSETVCILNSCFPHKDILRIFLNSSVKLIFDDEVVPYEKRRYIFMQDKKLLWDDIFLKFANISMKEYFANYDKFFLENALEYNGLIN